MTEENRKFYYAKGRMLLGLIISPIFLALGGLMLLLAFIDKSIFIFFLALTILAIFGSFTVANILKLIRKYPFIMITDNYIQLHPHTKIEATIYFTDINHIKVTEQSFQKNIEIVLNNEQAYFKQLSLHNKTRLFMNRVFNFSLYTFNIKFIKKEQRTELLQLLDFIMETKYEDNSTGSEKLTKENIEKYDPSPTIDKSVGKSFFKKAYGYSFFMFALAFVFFYFLISKDTGYLIYIIISFILYPFARALIDLIFGFKLRHLLDKQKVVTYYFNQLLFFLDFILYHLSLFVAPIAIIVLLIRYIIIKIKH